RRVPDGRRLPRSLYQQTHCRAWLGAVAAHPLWRPDHQLQFALAGGVAAGAIQGYYGGLTDLLFQRFIEIWSGLPLLYLLIILSSIIQPNFWWLLGIMLLFSWMSLVALVRAEFLRARNFDYVRAARALGVANPVIIVRHVLPNAMVATLTFLPFILNGSITTLTSLDFLGFGLPPGSP